MNDNHTKSVIGLFQAYNGLKETFRTERNFRIHSIVALAVIAAGFALHLPLIKWAFISLLIGLVLTAELFNTAVEKMLDYLRPNIHPQAKVIKDIAAGAVLISAIAAAVAGIIIFLPELG
ncbi:diacylglycerol kinase family protein [Lentibacillus kimchii]|uniref:Diacylglycerol kinase family protein n=1 Tax=Lentibacillus kimchii TaxID=1542911 RepID=A0ABW2UW12_9BACI